MEVLEHLTRKAVDLFGGQSDGMFNSACFSVAVKSEFKLPGVPDGGWAARVLSGLPYVVAMPGGCHWLYRPKSVYRPGYP